MIFFCWSSLASDGLLGFLSDWSAEKGPRGEEGRSIIIIWGNSARSALMITFLLVSAQYLWISDFVSTWLQLPLHTVLDQRRERCSLTWAYSVDLERLRHKLVKCSHVTFCRCVNSRKISDDILRDLKPLPFCFSFARSRTRIQGKYFFLASAKISSAFTSTNVLARRAITSVVRRDNRDYWRINSTFPCPSLLDSRGRREVRTNVPDLDSNAIYTRCNVPAPERVSSSLSMLSHASVVLA